MRLLFDPVLTAHPAKCSTNAQFVRIADKLLNQLKRDDVFIYWLRPEWLTEEEKATYIQHPAIRYFDVPQHKDRTFEYLRFGDHLANKFWFYGELWDFDIAVTVRTGLAALMKMVSSSPRMKKHDWLKQIWVLEQMPLMTFKETVMTFNPDVQDRFTLDGYLAADQVMVCSYHEPQQIIQAAMKFLPPSAVIKLRTKIEPMIPGKITNMSLKPQADRFVKGGKKPFCIAYVGRMEKANNIDDVKDIMEKQFIMKGDKVDLLVCTVSKVIKSFTKANFDIRHAGRDEFWDLAKNRMHVLVKMSKSSGYNASMMEPIFMGTPCICIDEDWSRPVLGDTYPFYVKNATQAYALLSEFYDDYEGMYAKFQEWYDGWLIPTYKIRFETDLLEDKFVRKMDEYAALRTTKFREIFPNKKHNGVYSEIAKEMKTDDNMFDAIKRLGEKGIVSDMHHKVDDDRLQDWNIIWQTFWHEIRIMLMLDFGYVDASPEPGHLKKA